MTEWHTIRVPKDVFTDVKAEKETREDCTWGEFLRQCCVNDDESPSSPSEIHTSLEVDRVMMREVMSESLGEMSITVDLADEAEVTESRVEELIRESIRENVHPKARDDV